MAAARVQVICEENWKSQKTKEAKQEQRGERACTASSRHGGQAYAAGGTRHEAPKK
jgi:hypothetical protein